MRRAGGGSYGVSGVFAQFTQLLSYGTTAVDMVACIWTRLAHYLEAILTARRIAIVLQHDAAKACIHAGAIFRKTMQDRAARADAVIYLSAASTHLC